jgi:hypothetical protein
VRQKLSDKPSIQRAFAGITSSLPPPEQGF